MNERNDGGILCSEVLAQLSNYVDQELDAPTADRIERHLSACRNCERFGRNFGRMVISVQKLKTDDPVDPSLLSSIKSAIDAAD